MSLKYFIGAICAIPLLPIMKYQGAKVRKSIPSLEAPTDTKGIVGVGQKSFRLLTLGESTIAGIGVDSHKDSISGQLANFIATDRQIKVEWEVIAKSGYTARLVNERLVSKIKNEYDLIVIGLGANDAFTLNTPMAWSKQIKSLIKGIRLQAPESPIVFLNMPPINSFPAMTTVLKWTIGSLVGILGKALSRAISDEPNLYFMDKVITLKSWSKKYKLKNDTSLYFSDGIHPSKLTYKLWAQETWAFCKEKVKL